MAAGPVKQGLLLRLHGLPPAAHPQQAARQAPTAELGATRREPQAGLLRQGQRQSMLLSTEQLMVLLAGQLVLSARQGPAAGCKGTRRAVLLRLMARRAAPARLLHLLRRLMPASLLLARLLKLTLMQTAPAQLLQLLHRLLPVGPLLAGWLGLATRQTAPARVWQIAVLLRGQLRLLQSQANPARSGQRGTSGPSSRPINSRLLPLQQRMCQPCCPRLSQATLLSAAQGPLLARLRNGQILQQICSRGLLTAGRAALRKPHLSHGPFCSPWSSSMALDPSSAPSGMRMQMKSRSCRPPSSSGIPLLALPGARLSRGPSLQEAAGHQACEGGPHAAAASAGQRQQQLGRCCDAEAEPGGMQIILPSARLAAGRCYTNAVAGVSHSLPGIEQLRREHSRTHRATRQAEPDATSKGRTG